MTIQHDNDDYHDVYSLSKVETFLVKISVIILEIVCVPVRIYFILEPAHTWVMNNFSP